MTSSDNPSLGERRVPAPPPASALRRWTTSRAGLAVAVFSIQAAFVAGYGAVRLGADSPVRPNPLGEVVSRVVDRGPSWGSPGYRALVAGSMGLGTGLLGIVALQLVVATAAAVGLEGLGRALGGPAAGLMAVALYVLNPDQLRWHAYLLPDSLYTSVLILAVAAIHAAWSSPTSGRLAAALAWGTGAGTLTATGYLLIPIALAFWSARRGMVRGARWAGYPTTVASLAWVVFMLPPVREMTLEGQPVSERPNRGVVVRDYQESWLPMPVETDRVQSGGIAGLGYVAAHPRESFHLAVLRIAAALAHVRPYYSPRHNLAVLGLLAPVYALAALGWAGSRREALAALLAAVVAAHLLVISLTYSDWDGRSLLFGLPLIEVLAARGLVMIRCLRKAMLPIGIAAVLAVILHAPFLTLLAFGLRVDDPAPSDALVLLLGGGRDRPEKAAELYRRGMGARILLGSDPDLRSNRQAMIEQGVPPAVILSLGPTLGTREEAQRIREYVQDHREVRRITVVTTAFHTARARWIFRRALMKTGVDVRIAASDDRRFDESDWYTSVAGLRAYSQEIFKFTYSILSDVH